ncbi:MAG: metallophosphoesterase [Salinirussus sp.]
MQVGVVSDTHDNLDVVEAAVDRFSGTVDAVVHCGDVVAPFAAREFDDDFEFYAVRGNNDGEWALQSVVEEFGVYLGEFGELAFGGTALAVYHGTSEGLVDALIECGRYDYVLRGHTHERVNEERDGTVHLNPGGIATDPGGADVPGAIVIDTETDDVAFHDLV